MNPEIIILCILAVSYVTTVVIQKVIINNIQKENEKIVSKMTKIDAQNKETFSNLCFSLEWQRTLNLRNEEQLKIIKKFYPNVYDATLEATEKERLSK